MFSRTEEKKKKILSKARTCFYFGSHSWRDFKQASLRKPILVKGPLLRMRDLLFQLVDRLLTGKVVK